VTRERANQRPAQHRLAGAGLAHDADRLPLVQTEVGSVNHGQLSATALAKTDAEILDFQQRLYFILLLLAKDKGNGRLPATTPARRTAGKSAQRGRGGDIVKCARISFPERVVLARMITHLPPC
jgi:hypothetical protein